MWLSRILRLARTSRWAIVASGTRKARAISPVSRPPSRRSVMATWVSGASAGWQHRNISRSWSSGTTSTSPRSGVMSGPRPVVVEPVGGEMSFAAARLAAQPVDGPVAGRRGDPPTGVGRDARLGPSLGRHREGVGDGVLGEIDVAEDADQRRRATARLAAVDLTEDTRIEHGVGRSRRQPSSPWKGRTSTGSLAGGRAPAGPVERGVEVGDVDDPEPADLLLRLGVGAVGHRHVAVGDPHDRGRLLRVQATGEHPHARRLDLGVEGVDLGDHPLLLLGRADVG